MFLANKGMTAFLMCPFRASGSVSGISRVNNTVSYIYEGPMWTQQEADTFRGQLLYTESGLTMGDRLLAMFNSIRRNLGYTSNVGPTLQGQLLTDKAHGNSPDEACFRMREPIPVRLTAWNEGTLGLLIVVTYLAYNTHTTSMIAVLSVGLPGSGAEVEIESTDVVSEDRIKLNDLYLKFSGLLGEA